MTDLRNTVRNRFKLNGLSISSDASKYLSEVFSRVKDNKAKLEKAVDKVVSNILKQPLEKSLIDQKICESAVKECRVEHVDSSEDIICVIQAFDVPRFEYLEERKKFIKSTEKPRLFDQAESKIRVFRERYQLVHQRTLRHDLFSGSFLGHADAEQNGRHYRLQPIEYLLGTTGRLKDILILGMLTQLREGRWHLEDMTGVVKLDFSQATFHKGLFPEACMVLTEGWYEDKTFYVTAMGLPPSESAEQTRDYFGPLNFFGGPSELCARANTKLARLEEVSEDAMVVFLSEVHLDSEEVCEKLATLFAGFAQSPPLAIVMCGNFSSTADHSPGALAHYRALFRRLARLMAAHGPLVERTRLLIVPGPGDLGLGRLLPRPPLPQALETELQQRLPLALLATNPVRVQCFTQELVVFREDLSVKMARHCLHTPREAASAPSAWAEHLARTVVSQAHLVPLPLHISPLYWAFDEALRVYPLPDLLLLADRTEAFSIAEAGGSCRVANPGPFSAAAEFAFKVYYPRDRVLEDSKIG